MQTLERDGCLVVYDEDFRNSAERHKIAFGKGLSGRVDFFLSRPPYNVQSDRKDDHEEYDVSVSSDMKVMARVLVLIMMPEAHKEVLCSVLQISRW